MKHFHKDLKKNEAKVGIFVLLSLSILFFSYSWLNDWFLKSKYESIQVLFDNVNNIERGNSVYFRGLRVGKVQKLEIVDEGVVVDLLIEKNIKLFDNAEFLIKEKDMMGTKAIDILPGTQKDYFKNNGYYRGTSSPGLSDLVSSLSVLSSQIENIMQKLEIDESLVNRMDNVLNLTERSFTQFSELLTDINDKQLINTLTEISNLSISMQEMISNNSENIEITFNNLNDFFVKIDSIGTKFDIVLSKVNENLHNEESNMNLLFNDDQLYKSLLKTTYELDQLINDIKKNPRKFFKFSIF